MPGQGPYTGGSMNVGKDLSLVFVINGVTYTQLGLLTDTGRKALNKEHEVIPTNNDAVPVRRVTHEGYEFEFTLTRQNGIFDQLVQAIQQNYFGGGVPEVITMTETIRNPDQSVNQTVYSGGSFVPESMGGFKSANPVDDIKFRCKFSQGEPTGGTAANQTNLNSPAQYL